MSVEQRVKQIIVEQLGVDENQVDNTASFVDDLGADSLDIVELVMAFEEAFDIDIPDEDAEKIATVKDAIDYIEAKKSNLTERTIAAQSCSDGRRTAQFGRNWDGGDLAVYSRGPQRHLADRAI